MDTVKVIEVIESTIARRGNGNTTPIRVITQYFTKKGKLLAEVDPSPDWENELQRLKNAVMWALGEGGEFPDKKSDEGMFWWREELRRIACLTKE